MQEKLQESRQRGRSAKKRLRKRIESVGQVKTWGELRLCLQELPPDQSAELMGRLLTPEQQDVVAQWQRDLARSRSLLRTEGVWVYFEKNQEAARRVGLEEVLKQLVLDQAGQFLGPGSVRLTAKYSRSG